MPPGLICSYIQHVQQLLRTLNLTSPAPFSPESFAGDFFPSPISPDVSPVSTTSALLTPPDQSPAKAFGEWKFNAVHDFGPAYQPQAPNHSLLFETDPQPYPDFPSFSNASYRPMEPFQSARSFPFFEPFADRSTAVSASNGARTRDPSVATSRQDSAFLHLASWPQSQSRARTTSVEWAKPEDRRHSEHSSATPSEASFYPSRSHGGSSAHEVSVYFLMTATTSHHIGYSADQLLDSASSILLPAI